MRFRDILADEPALRFVDHVFLRVMKDIDPASTRSVRRLINPDLIFPLGLFQAFAVLFPLVPLVEDKKGLWDEAVGLWETADLVENHIVKVVFSAHVLIPRKMINFLEPVNGAEPLPFPGS
jgi:hypothetical protein